MYTSPKYIFIGLVIISLITVWLLPTLLGVNGAHAGILDDLIIEKDGREVGPTNLCQTLVLLVNIRNLVMLVAGPICALMIIIGGVMMSASAGNPTMTEQAKKILYGGIIGLIIVAVAWLIVTGIIAALFDIKVWEAWWTIDCGAIGT